MSDPVYDLGSIDITAERPAANGAAAMRRGGPAATTVHRVATTPVGVGGRTFDTAGTLALFLPGTGHFVQREFAAGLFVLSSFGFLGTLSWAMVETLDRIIDTLRVLGYPGAPAVWALAGLFAFAALLHVGNLLTIPVRHDIGAHPAVAGLASAIVPGWGQILNGTRGRGAMFVASLWAVAALWILQSPAVAERMDAVGLFLPEVLHRIAVPAVLWTTPAVIWALAVYDAISTAASRS